MPHHNNDLGGHKSPNSASHQKDLNAPPASEFVEFLGFDRCPLTLPKLVPHEDTNILYLPWIHQPEKVPLVLKEIQNALELRPTTRAVVILSELVGPTAEEKRELEKLVETAVNSEVTKGSKVYREMHDSQHDGARINPLMFEKMKAFRQIAWSGIAGQEKFRNGLQGILDGIFGGPREVEGPTVPVFVKFIDITEKRDTNEIFRVLREEIESQRIRQAFDTVTLGNLRQQIGLPANPSPAQRMRAAEEMLSIVTAMAAQDQAILTQLISPYRNRTMASQIKEARAAVSDDLLVVLLGAGHSGVPFLESKKPDVSVRFIGLPDEFLQKLPDSFKQQSFSSLRMNSAMLRVQGVDVPDELIKRALIEPYLSARIYSAFSSFPWMKHKALHQELQSTEAVELIVRTSLLMLPEESIDGLLDALCIAPFHSAFDGHGKMSMGNLYGAIIDDWILQQHPDYAAGRSSVDYSSFVNYIYEKYLLV